jgi:hypothetical protein
MGVGSMNDANIRHATVHGVNPIDHAAGTAADAVSVIERRAKALTHPVRVVQQWADDEFGCGKVIATPP